MAARCLHNPLHGPIAPRKSCCATSWWPALPSAVLLSLILGVGVATWQAQQARADQRRAEQVKAFLASIFVDIDPNYGQGGRVPASAILLKASRRIDNEFGADPRLALEVATLVGNGLVETNESKAGRRDHRIGLAALRKSPVAVGSAVLRGRSAELRAHAPPARCRGRRSLPDLTSKLRASDPSLTEELVFALISFATIESGAVACHRLLQRPRRQRSRPSRLGENHKVSIEALDHSSNMLLGAGKPDEARVVAERGVAAAHSVYQRPHPMISESRVPTGQRADASREAPRRCCVAHAGTGRRKPCMGTVHRRSQTHISLGHRPGIQRTDAKRVYNT